ncbi:MAG: hypothetical protein ACTSVF_05195 [Candidatus Asgardarchaeia archaeon]
MELKHAAFEDFLRENYEERKVQSTLRELKTLEGLDQVLEHQNLAILQRAARKEGLTEADLGLRDRERIKDVLIGKRVVERFVDLAYKEAQEIFTRHGELAQVYFQMYILRKLTLINDYTKERSINFMSGVRNVEGDLIAVGNFTFSKESRLLYLKNYAFQRQDPPAAALLISAAKNHLKKHGFKPLYVVAAIPSHKKDDIKTFREMGMKFLSLKTDNISLPIFKAGPVKKNHFFMVARLSRGRSRITVDNLSRLMKDSEEEEILNLLLNVGFKDVETVENISEVEVLIRTFQAIYKIRDNKPIKHAERE